MNITPFEDAIKNHLDKVAKKDKLFAKNYKKENKSLDECVKYILQEVKKAAKNNNRVQVLDDEIYNLAIHYYDEDSIKVDTAIPAVKVMHSTAPSAPKATKTTAKKAKAKKTEAPADDEYVPLSLEIPLFE